MCIFTKSVDWVGGTSIYARRTSADRQNLVYQMSFRAKEPVAMVLPVPTPPAGAAEDDVRFIDFREHGHFFRDIRSSFERETWRSRFERWRGRDVYEDGGRPAPRLVVHEIGHFDASFVPGRADFGRLDPRFQLSDDVWRGLRQYEDYGFVVFQLRSGKWTAHPMAFEFTTRDSRRLYFPTVHVHDSKVRPFARFEHELFAQRTSRGRLRWRRSARLVGWPSGMPEVLDSSPQAWFYRRAIKGYRPNRDTWVRDSGGVAV